MQVAGQIESLGCDSMQSRMTFKRNQLYQGFEETVQRYGRIYIGK
jgi:hypothetical protein